MKEQFLWCEKYRPSTIDECILPDTLKQTFKSLVSKGEMINLLFSGTAGTGKTTSAKALCNELGCDYIVVNGSDEGRSIDVLRDKIKKFVTTASMQDSPKVVIIDEADYLGLAVQPALRNFIEEFSSNARFILTCNYKHKIIEPLHSRCSVIDFTLAKADRPKLAIDFARRTFEILEKEQVEHSKEAVVEVVKTYFPDNRRILNELQRYSQVSGKVDSGVISVLTGSSVAALVKHLKDRDFKSCRQWIANSPDQDTLFADLYDNISDLVESDSVPTLILILGEYQMRAAHVANAEINMAAFCVEVIKSIKWK